jgi:transcriptional regulator with XRE-family HTH domain
MDAVRFGHQVRALRRRRGWRQQDLADRGSMSRGVIAGIEQGRGDRVTVATLDRVAAVLGAHITWRLEWQGENLDRLLDADHARLVEQIVSRLSAAGWTCAAEVSFSVYGERGSIDVMAFRPDGDAILVVEAKTWLPDVGGMLMTLDRKQRLAAGIARERGWPVGKVSKLLVVRDSGTSRRRVALHAATFDAALPDRGQAVRRWLRAPTVTTAGLLFLPDDTHLVTSRRGRIRPRGRQHGNAVGSRRSTA